jgi:hypothetical protein
MYKSGPVLPLNLADYFAPLYLLLDEKILFFLTNRYYFLSSSSRIGIIASSSVPSFLFLRKQDRCCF